MQLSKLSNFYIRSGLFAILSLAGALFNYALYPILVRILSESEFGDFAVIVAISNQILGILLAFNIVSIYLVKTHDEAKARDQAQVLQKYLIWAFIGLTFLVLLSSSYLQKLLNVENVYSFFILGLILLAAIPAIIWTGFLQGNKELIRVGGFNLSASVAKLIFAVIFAISFGANGGLIGVLFGAIVGLTVLRIIPGIRLPSLNSLFTKSTPEEKKFIVNIRNYALTCVIVVGALSFLQNYDIILAKTLFDPTTAGLYSGVSILSNALYYVCFLLIWIILPEIKINDYAVNHRLLKTAYKVLAILALFVISVEYISKGQVAGLLLGSNFKIQGDLLLFATLYQLTLVAITLYAYYLLVSRKRRVVILGGLVFMFSVSLPMVLATTPLNMIQYLWFSLLAGIMMYFAIVKLIRV